ncbi:hypothetical protein [Natrialba aegyptia]|uniref:hypothetical protein n=1 Tax=Natrialba aegyptia TaxID=129789 RepID=UPI001267A086|nr:hypothetical protein [Natrialba aegyptia]
MREFRLWVKIALFASSYIPFYAIMAVITRDLTHTLVGYEIPSVSIVFIVLLIGSGWVLQKIMDLRESEEPNPKHISSVRRRNDLLTSYLVAYIFPFISLDYALWESWFVLAVFFGVLGSIQVQSDQLYVNPVLAAFGYHIYEVEDADSGNVDLVVAPKSEQLSTETHLDAVRAGSNVYIAV